VGSQLKESRLYQTRKEQLSPADLKRLENEEHQIATGEEEYRAMEHADYRIHNFDYGQITFMPLGPELTLLIAFKLYDRI
jgi:hypothetical protein